MEAEAGLTNAAAGLSLGNETLAAVVARLKANIETTEGDETGEDERDGGIEHGDGDGDVGQVDYGNHNHNWEDGHSSWDEFGHDNDPSVCKMRTMTAGEWEAGRHWRNNVPVMVTNVTDSWAANFHWRLDEMLKRYPDAEATMGDGRRVGEIGPDAAGRLLSPTTVREFITEHMYDPFKYFFDRKIAIPKGMLEDCRPFPLPTRKFLDDPLTGTMYAPSKKERVHPFGGEGERWLDHLAIAIGADLRGLTFHHHGAAWNAVIFGKKRWILYDPRRWRDNEEEPDLQRRMALATNDSWQTILPSHEWIRQLLPDPWRVEELRLHGMDCIQHAGTMMFVPRGWMHMVVNIGDTVSVISEVGLDKGEGKKPEDFLYDPHASSDDEDEGSGDDDYYGGGKGPVRRGRERRGPPSGGRGRGPPPPPEDSSDDEYEDSEDSYDDSEDDEE